MMCKAKSDSADATPWRSPGHKSRAARAESSLYADQMRGFPELVAAWPAIANSRFDSIFRSGCSVHHLLPQCADPSCVNTHPHDSPVLQWLTVFFPLILFPSAQQQNSPKFQKIKYINIIFLSISRKSPSPKKATHMQEFPMTKIKRNPEKRVTNCKESWQSRTSLFCNNRSDHKLAQSIKNQLKSSPNSR